MRTFETGATRDTNEGKPDYEGFLSPLVIQRFGQYMLKHQRQADGKLRAADNWQKGMPQDDYIKSAWRHFLDWWLEHDGYESREGLEDALCALMFNVMGYLHEHLKQGAALPDVDWDNFFKVHSQPCRQTCTACSHGRDSSHGHAKG